MAGSNRYAEAFKEGANLLGMTGVVAASLIALSPLPLLAGLAAEAAYLLFVPDSKWYAARLGRREQDTLQLRRRAFRDQTLPQLRDTVRDRYLHLETVGEQIRGQATADKRYYGDVLPKLDYLLDKFLVFATKETQFRAYLRTIWEECRGVTAQSAFEYPRSDPRAAAKPRFDGAVPRGHAPEAVDSWVPKVVAEVQQHYEGEVDNLARLEEAEADANTKAVLGKRIDVLKQRHEFVEKIGRILTNLSYQMELLEDTFGLINDQIRARSPEQVLSEIEGVVFQTDSMTQLLEELAPFEQLTNASA